MLYHDPSGSQSHKHSGTLLGDVGWPEKAYKVHDPFLIFWIVTAPEFDSLHSEPRYQKIVRDMHLTLPSDSAWPLT